MIQRTLFDWVAKKSGAGKSIVAATATAAEGSLSATRKRSRSASREAHNKENNTVSAANSKCNATIDVDADNSNDNNDIIDYDKSNTNSNNNNNSSKSSNDQKKVCNDDLCALQENETETCNMETRQVSSSKWLAELITDYKWKTFLSPLLADNWHHGLFCKIEHFLDEQTRAHKVIYPPRDKIFAAFNSTPFEELKVILLGQDPYHNPGQAHGLCFSVLPGVTPPPSLMNMYKELHNDIPGFTIPSHGYLQSWAGQGMLMLNATLTVEAHCANSHANCGWQEFTNAVIAHLSSHHPNRLVFLLWGNFARKKKALIDVHRHVVIENAHPSPLSAARWWNCKCFSKCNTELKRLGHTPMQWQLPLNV